jgi:hypothetical protein
MLPYNVSGVLLPIEVVSGDTLATLDFGRTSNDEKVAAFACRVS